MCVYMHLCVCLYIRMPVCANVSVCIWVCVCLSVPVLCRELFGDGVMESKIEAIEIISSLLQVGVCSHGMVLVADQWSLTLYRSVGQSNHVIGYDIVENSGLCNLPVYRLYN